MRMVLVCIGGPEIHSSRGPIILGFSIGCLYLYCLMSSLHVELSQIQGFPLLAQVSRGLGNSYGSAALHTF